MILFTQLDSDPPKIVLSALSHCCFRSGSSECGLTRWVLMFGCCDNEWDVGDGWVAPFRRTTDHSCAVGEAPSGRWTRTSTSGFQWYQRRWVESKKLLFLLLEGYPWDVRKWKDMIHEIRHTTRNATEEMFVVVCERVGPAVKNKLWIAVAHTGRRSHWKTNVEKWILK